MADGTAVLSTHLTEAQKAAFEAKARVAGMAPEEALRILALRYIDAGGRMPVVKMTDAPAALRRRLDLCAKRQDPTPKA